MNKFITRESSSLSTHNCFTIIARMDYKTASIKQNRHIAIILRKHHEREREDDNNDDDDGRDM